jgi:hypothetical protein
MNLTDGAALSVQGQLGVEDCQAEIDGNLFSIMLIRECVLVLRRPRTRRLKKPRLNWRVMMGLDGQASTRAV